MIDPPATVVCDALLRATCRLSVVLAKSDGYDDQRTVKIGRTRKKFSWTSYILAPATNRFHQVNEA